MFTVTLPVRAVRQTDEDNDVVSALDDLHQAILALPAVRLDGLRILVVDDEADARRLLTKVLGDVGAIVTSVSSAAEALTILRQNLLPHVLVSDIGMPDQNGFDLIRLIRREGHTARDLPAVALTAFVNKEMQRQALLAGFQVHVPKPVDPHDLTVVIASLAGRTG